MDTTPKPIGLIMEGLSIGKQAHAISDARLRRIDQTVATALAIEDDPDNPDARRFMARLLIQATLPHSKPEGTEFVRTNGKLTLTAQAPSSTGLAYGSIPRLLLAWMTTEAVRTQHRELVLGDSLSGFMSQLGLVATGGRWGSIGRIKNQTRRLFSTTFRATYTDPRAEAGMGLLVADKHYLWWDAPDPGQMALWQSKVFLSEPFFREITDRPFPVDMRALMELKQSPMALDVYMWLTYRMSYLKKPTLIPWLSLRNQFGAGYALTPKGLKNFRAKFLTALKAVNAVYPVNVASAEGGLLLSPGRTHVPGRVGTVFDQ